MQMKRAIIVFTRAPVPGQTKTRLMPAFGPRQCARLHTCFLRDIQAQCKKIWAAHLAQAFDMLKTRDVVFGPFFGRRILSGGHEKAL